MAVERCAGLRGPGVEKLARWLQGAEKKRIALMTMHELRVDGQDTEGRQMRNMAGGMGILQYDHACAEAHPDMRHPDLRFVFSALAHTEGRGDQEIVPGGQKMRPTPWSIRENPNFASIGVIEDVIVGRDRHNGRVETVSAEGFLYLPLLEGQMDTPAVLFATNRTDITGEFYPPDQTLTALQAQLVLGRTSYLLGKELGLWEREPGEAAAIIHDCHGAFLAWYMLAEFLAAGLEPETALTATRERNLTTVHAPQPGTANKYAYDVLSKVFTDYEIGQLYSLGRYGPDPALVNTIILAMELSRGVSFVSPGHYELSMDPANNLVPKHMFGRKRFGTTSNIVHPLNWMDGGQIDLLDTFIPGWRGNPDLFTPELQAQLLFHEGFRRQFMGIVAERTLILAQLLKDQGIILPEDTIVPAAMRRATDYKLRLAKDILMTCQADLVNLAQKYGPLHLLFGGLVPHGDIQSAVTFGNMLELLASLDRIDNNLGAGWFPNYNEYTSPSIIQGVDIWMMFSDSLTPNSGRKEAFGPSGGKKQQLGGLTLGASDGWAPHFNGLGAATTIFGPFTQLHGRDAGKALRERMISGEAYRAAFLNLVDSFVFHFGNQLALLRQERQFMKENRGHESPALPIRLAAMFNGLNNFHPRRLSDAYHRMIVQS
ncbi:MAG: hypothetical protein ABIE84_05170 [bacterium]